MVIESRAESMAGLERACDTMWKRASLAQALCLTICAATLFLCFIAAAQPTSAPPSTQDPLMALMLSQPKLDVHSPVYAETSFDPPQARPGQAVVYRITLNALKDAIAWDEKLPEVQGMTFRRGAKAEIMQMTGTNITPRTAFNFHAEPLRLGAYVVPEFSIRVYGSDVRVPAATLLVSASAPAVAAQKLLLEVTPRRPFVGESVRVRVLSPGSPAGVISALAQVQLNGTGFMQEVTANRQGVESLILNGRATPHFIYETVLTPILPGPTEIFAQAFSVGNRLSGTVVITGPATISGSSIQYLLVDSDPLRLEFRPLPSEGRPPGFAGAVGDYITETPQLSTNVVRVGEPVQLTVGVKGRGNLARLVLAEPPRLANWQVFEPRQERLPAQVTAAKGVVNFTYTMIPMREDITSTPELPFSFFHPDRGEYVSQNIRPVAIRVLPGDKSADLAALLRQRVSGAGTEREPVLGPVASTPGVQVSTLMPLQLRSWFPVLQLAPAAVFAGLLLWDRRRRYLEAHPEVVRKRRARRTLRQHRRRMREQSRWGNEIGFADSAVAAMQAASAPHFPAAPGAVTKVEVLQLLGADAPDDLRQTAIRFFEFSNARRYSETPASADALPLPVEAEKVLAVLEEKL